MKEIPLTRPIGAVALVDDEDFEAVMKWPWWGWKPKRSKVMYACLATGNADPSVSRYMHLFIMGAPPPGRVCDHVNGVGLDNRRCNLRWATPTQNGWNEHARRGGCSAYKGVSRTGRSRVRPWIAQIRAGGTVRYIGSYATELEAALAYDQVARALRGEFANLNFPGTEVPLLDGVQKILQKNFDRA